MKVLFLLMMLSLNTHAFTQLQASPKISCEENAETASKIQAAKDLVARYQPQIQARFGEKAELVFEKTNDCKWIQAYASREEGKMFIRIYPGLINALDHDALTFAVCHELGHYLGSVTPIETKVETKFDHRDSIEGEADYFGGACARSVLCAPEDKLCERAVDAGRAALQAFQGSKTIIDPDLAQHKKYKKYHGINPEYPDVHCRMLSIIYGVIGEERPSCWYNPKTNKNR